MKHIISFSGGAASFAAGHLVIEQHGAENVVLAFCDTLIEDADLYRFIIEGAAALYGMTPSPFLMEAVLNIPAIDNPERADHLFDLSKHAMKELPQLVWLMDGRDPWQVYRDRKYQGNTRMAHCTVELKGKAFAKWLTASYQPEECVIHFGFDWAEEKRLSDARNNWAPYQCQAELCAPPYLSRSQVFQIVDDYDMELPRLYKLGFAHNNCGGFCVKAGQAHYENLLRTMPEVYAYHEAEQERLFQELPTAKPFIRLTRNKKTSYLTLKQFREHLQAGGEYQEFEYGGCGCFSDASACGLANLVGNDNAEKQISAG